MEKSIYILPHIVSDGQIKPKSVDFLRTSNRQAHRTSDYEIPNLIIRRGQQFDLSITFDRPFSIKQDEVVLKFVTGRNVFNSFCIKDNDPEVRRRFENIVEKGETAGRHHVFCASQNKLQCWRHIYFVVYNAFNLTDTKILSLKFFFFLLW